ncbi:MULTISPECIES: hypothetical protein [unclassified Leptolyngbya]|uniref:hypothetical protein n=1 Tax=unclassified Leptolyngbya TaxID=2650499 RepID=UPI001683B3AE|nr:MULTISPECIES: hypothetical protein [unclassified Leptolyngbya]MBD1913745.1 hypothetical protein [Leptolyngbya sp. FACHB-8]MBD2153219.1 hypothetical protein [Leptolyngbya sp. FACHB-16]
MGKQRVTQLLAQLRENQAKDLENAANIYTVAQVAVNALDAAEGQSTEPSQQKALPEVPLPAIPTITKAALLEQYGSFNGCRLAAKKLGIRFSKTPSWAKMEAAFSYREACQQLIQQYLKKNPNEHLQGVALEVSLDLPE